MELVDAFQGETVATLTQRGRVTCCAFLSLYEFSGLGLLYETCAAAGLGFANDW